MRCAVALLAAGALSLAACAGAPGGAQAGSTEGRRIEVPMKEFAFGTSTLSVKAGERVTLVFKNTGTVEHEFMAGRNGTGGKGFADDLFKDVEHEIVPAPASDHGMGHAEAVGVRVLAGRTATMTFIVPDRPGTYEFGCFVAGHYEAGMKGTFTIE